MLVCHRDDDISLLLSGFGVPVRFGHLFQQIVPVDNWLEYSRLN